MDIVIVASNSCSAFWFGAIGTKVIDRTAFLITLLLAIGKHDPSKDRVPGQHYIDLGTSPNVLASVSAGVGLRAGRTIKDYVIREHRGRVGAYLYRTCAAPTEGVAAVVYTREAYLADPDITAEEATRIMDAKATHVIVAVLGFAGPNPPLTPGRFVQNLAGGNREALTYDADTIRAMAKDIAAYSNEYCVVAD